MFDQTDSADYLKLPNVFILPHLGSSTLKTRTAMANLAIKNLDDFFRTGKCENKVVAPLKWASAELIHPIPKWSER